MKISKDVVTRAIINSGEYTPSVQKDLAVLVWSLIDKASNSNTIKVLNTLYCKQPVDLINEAGKRFMFRLLVNHINPLIMLDKSIKNTASVIKELGEDLEAVINTICRDGVIPIELEKSDTNYVYLKGLIIHNYTKNEIQASEIAKFNSLLVPYFNWVSSNKKLCRKHINNLRASTEHKVLQVVDNDMYMSTVVNGIIDEINYSLIADKQTIPEHIHNIISVLFCFKTFWLVIPDEVLPLKSRRLLGRYINRLRILKETKCQ